MKLVRLNQTIKSTSGWTDPPIAITLGFPGRERKHRRLFLAWYARDVTLNLEMPPPVGTLN